MRVVVVGATGNVGTSLVRALGESPEVESILGLSRRRPDWAPPKTEWAAADMAHDDLASLLRGAAVVVHLAWLFQPSHRPDMTWQVNVGGSSRVFDAVASADVPALVYASSVGAYSPGPKDAPVDESWPTHGWPQAGYTREKAYVERLLDTFERQYPDRRVVRLRPAFVFQRESASQQRRLFGGPLLPTRLLRPGRVPFVPDLAGLRFQAVHTADAAQAYRLAVLGDARGAFNIAAEPVLDAHRLADLLGTRTVSMPAWVARQVVAAAWHLHLAPASPHLFDAMLRMPVMDTTRAREVLGWAPRHSATDALRAFFEGLHETAGMPTPPLDPHAGGRLREREVGSGTGARP